VLDNEHIVAHIDEVSTIPQLTDRLLQLNYIFHVLYEYLELHLTKSLDNLNFCFLEYNGISLREWQRLLSIQSVRQKVYLRLLENQFLHLDKILYLLSFREYVHENCVV